MTDDIDDIKCMLSSILKSLNDIDTRLKKVEIIADAIDPNGEILFRKDEVLIDESEFLKRLAIEEKLECTDYLMKHYQYDCNLNENMTVENFKEYGFELTDAEMLSAQSMYNDLTEVL